MTAPARNVNSPTTVRELFTPRGTSLGSRIAPRTPSTAPFVSKSSSTRCRNLKVIRPFFSASRVRRTNGSSTPGPVPQVM